MMGKFLIVVCEKCKQPSLAFDGQKTRQCPYCGNNIKISVIKVLAKADTPEQARHILAEEKKARAKKAV